MKYLFAIVILIKVVLVFVKYFIQNAVYFINKTKAFAVGTTGVRVFFFVLFSENSLKNQINVVCKCKI